MLRGESPAHLYRVSNRPRGTLLGAFELGLASTKELKLYVVSVEVLFAVSQDISTIVVFVGSRSRGRASSITRVLSVCSKPPPASGIFSHSMVGFWTTKANNASRTNRNILIPMVIGSRHFDIFTAEGGNYDPEPTPKKNKAERYCVFSWSSSTAACKTNNATKTTKEAYRTV